ncbi:MAG: Rieske (2Fe-2S) protein [Candidatus Manganitrophus sp. SB1]|nr:Rieske (2Fe-2S) protein [Candidatus Manganitrophus morganii]
MIEYQPIGKTADLPEGKGKEVKVGHRQILLMNIDGLFYALDRFCAHRAAPLVQGEVVDGKLLCPWHGNTLDVATGSCLANPEDKVRTYPVEVRGEEIWVGMEHEP